MTPELLKKVLGGAAKLLDDIDFNGDDQLKKIVGLVYVAAFESSLMKEELGKAWDAGYQRGEDQGNVLKPEGNIYPNKEEYLKRFI